MTRPIKKIHNTETNEIINRELNDAEYAQHLLDLEAKAIADAEAEARATAKAALLERLGITAEEAQLLIGDN